MKRYGKQQAAGWAKANKEDTIQKRAAKGSVEPKDEAGMDAFARCCKRFPLKYVVDRYNVVSRIKRKRLGHCEYLYSLLFTLNYLFCSLYDSCA
jgi:hypothetical protein